MSEISAAPPAPQPPPRARTATRAELVRAPLLVGAAGLSATAALRVRDPHDQGSWGFCPFQALTGLPCPACGGLRAVNDLTHGDVLAALGSNAFAVAFMAAIGVAWVRWLVRRWRGHSAPMLSMTTWMWLPVAGAALAFGIFRWTPWGAALAP